MNLTIPKLFIILVIDPDKGRITLDRTHLIYTLSGAFLMEYLNCGELTIENKRIIPSFTHNGDLLHDFFADTIVNSNKNRRISFWIRRITNKNRFLLREIINSLEKEKTLRIEHKKFLNIFPYKRYWFTDNSLRTNLIETLREILIYGKKPSKTDLMFLGLVEASGAYPLLSRERGESKLLRKKNTEILKGDLMSTEISQAIKEIQVTIAASITAAIIASHGSH